MSLATSIPVRFDALLFDFDGVLIESEYASSRQIAEYLTGIGHPTSPEQSIAQFTGLAGPDFHAAVEQWIGGPIPEGFHIARRAEDERALREEIAEVAGAVAFVHALPPALPKAIVSSSTTGWIRHHLDRLGLLAAFEGHIYSGREHVVHGKPAPDLYLLAAQRLGVAIARAAILEDSAVGATGAVASGGHVIGLVAGSHCGDGHPDRLRAIGVAAVASSFDEVAALLA